MRIYIAQFLSEEVLQKSSHGRALMGPANNSTSRILVDREHDFDDESVVTYSSP